MFTRTWKLWQKTVLPVKGLSKIIDTLSKKIQSFTLKTVSLETVCNLTEEMTNSILMLEIKTVG